MEWKQVTPELKTLLETGMLPFDCEKRAMFGAPTYFRNNNMFAGIHGDTIIIRLPDEDRKEILAKYRDARPFEPMKGHFMKEYIALPESFYNNKHILREWLNRAFNYASSLPPKERKSRTAVQKRTTK
jgi:TfoX/Sxy family transcriptional regulator of competence genes